MKNPSALFELSTSFQFEKNPSRAMDLNEYLIKSMNKMIPISVFLEELATEIIRNMTDSGKAFKNIVSALWYSRLPCYEVEGMTGSFKGESSILKDCMWKGKKVTLSLT